MRRGVAVPLLTAGAVGVMVASCGREAGEVPVADPGPPADAEAYSGVRGRVFSLPSGGPPPVDLQIHHERIADFRDGTGAVVGMNAMRMPFPRLVPGETLEGIEPGDVVEFDMFVSWSDGVAAWWIDVTRELDPGTELEFEVRFEVEAGAGGATPGE